MKSAQDVIHHFINGNSRVLPGVQDATVNGQYKSRRIVRWYLRRDVLKDSGSDSASNWVQHVRKMILREHGMSWVGAMRVIPGLELRICAG
jgi:hypothetical protein